MKIRLSTLAPLGLVLALAACGGEQAGDTPAAEPAAQSSEFVAESPTDPAIPVDLPSTAMTNAPEAADTAK